MILTPAVRWGAAPGPLAAAQQARATIGGCAVCLMTDGDQTGALVEGWYGGITLQAR